MSMQLHHYYLLVAVILLLPEMSDNWRRAGGIGALIAGALFWWLS